MNRALVCAALSLCLAGCGPAADSPPERTNEASSTPEDRPPATEHLRLRIAFREELPTLAPLLARWGERNGTRVEVDITSEPLDSGVEYSLVEIDGAQLGDLAASQRVREVEVWRELAKELSASGSGVFRGRLMGIPWRGRWHGLRLADRSAPKTWAELARAAKEGGGLAMLRARSGLSPWSFLALSWGNGAIFVDPDSGELRLDPAPAEEALAYLVRVHGRGARLSGAEELASHLSAGGVAAAWRTEEPGWSGIPASDGDAPVAWVETRILCVPRRAPYFELAGELLAFLCADSTAAAVAQDGWVSLRSDPPTGVRAAYFPAEQDLERAFDLWSSAIEAVLDRRRGPQAALTEAQGRWMQGELLE